MAFADSKRLVAEWALAETEVVRDKTLVKAASLKSERKCLAQSITDSADEMLGRALSKKEGLCVELTSMKVRFIELEKTLAH